MKYTITVLLLCTGCATFQPTPKPQSGGGVSVELQPIRFTTLGPENADTPTVSNYERSYVTPAGERVNESFTSTLGISQHDQARDDWGSVRKFEAQLKSYGSIRVFGFGLLLAALAMFHPVVRRITGSTGQIATGALGLVCVFGGSIVAGNETLIIIAAILGLAVYLFARRHGQLQGIVDKSGG